MDKGGVVYKIEYYYIKQIITQPLKKYLVICDTWIDLEGTRLSVIS